MTAPDGRPRPQYGEYATPEEQRAHIKQPAPHLFEPPQPAQPDAAPPYLSPPGRPGARQQATSRGIDRVVTLALLALGLYSVLSTLVTMTDLAGYLDHTMTQIGMGSYTATSATGVIAAVVSGVNVVAWAAAAVLSVLSMRAGRVSFWIPLVVGVVVTVITAVCYAVLLMGDPSFVDYISRAS